MIKNILLAIAGLLVAGLIWNSCNKDKEIKKLKIDLEDTVFSIKNKYGHIISVKDAELSDSQESMKNLREDLFQTTDKYNKKVKEVKALIAIKQHVRIDSVKIPYIDTPKMRQWADSQFANCKEVIKYYEDSTVLIGTTARDTTPYYIVDVTVEKKGIEINEIQFIDSQYVSITKFKGGLFKRDTKGKLKMFLPRKTKIEILHTNPYFKNRGVDTFIYAPPNKHPFLKGAGVGAGLTLIIALTRL